jgi:hypothetical protein
MAVGTVSGVDPQDNWQLIATNTPSSVTISSFTSISGYKRLMVVLKGVTSGSAGNIYLQFNSDTTSGNYAGVAELDSVYSFQQLSAIPSTGYSTTTHSGYLVIEDVDKSIPHRVSGGGYTAAIINAIWFGATPITQIDVKMSSTFSGTIYLYGIAA